MLWLEQDGKQVETRQETLLIRGAGNSLLASVPFSAFFKRGSAQGQPVLYAWARIERIGADRITIAVHSVEAFKPQQGDKLRFIGKPGSNDRDAAVMSGVTGEMLNQLAPGVQAWEAVIVYRKLPAAGAYPLRGLAPAGEATK